MQKAFVGRALVAVTLTLIPASAQERPILELGKIVERELAGNQTHRYALTLARNQIARVVAEQSGVDLVLSVFAPDSSKLFDLDTPNGMRGEERATIATREGGRYGVEIRPTDPTQASGRYSIRLDRFLNQSDYLTDRLAGLGRAWGAVKFFHPFLAYRPIDWDGALVTAIPAVKAAFTAAEYRAAIGTMLDALNDSATTAELPSIEHSGSPAASDGGGRSYYRVVDGVVVVNATDWASLYVNGDRAQFAKQPEMLAEIGKASGVVIDCRYAGTLPAGASFYLNLYLETLLPLIVKGSVPLGTERYRLHNGYAPQRGNSSGGYESSFLTRTPGAIVGQARDPKPLAVITNERTPSLLPVLSGLQAAGAKIVQLGDVKIAARSNPVMLADSVRVNVRVAEFVPPVGSVFRPDVQLTKDAGTGDSGIAAAIAALRSPTSNRPQATTSVSAPEIVLGQKDNPYAQMSFPTEEYRLLALFRFWNVIHYFYPYKQLTDRPWETLLADFIPRFTENQSALDYQRTVAEMVARMQDTHGGVTGLQALGEHLGTFAPALRPASTGGQLTIVELIDAAAAQSAGVELGDVIMTIDGQPVAERLAQLSRLRSLSTVQAAYAGIYPTALRGAKGTIAKLRVAGTDGQTRDVEIPRTVSLGSVAGMLPRKTPISQVLPSGYHRPGALTAV